MVPGDINIGVIAVLTFNSWCNELHWTTTTATTIFWLKVNFFCPSKKINKCHNNDKTTTYCITGSPNVRGFTGASVGTFWDKSDASLIPPPQKRYSVNWKLHLPFVAGTMLTNVSPFKGCNSWSHWYHLEQSSTLVDTFHDTVLAKAGFLWSS